MSQNENKLLEFLEWFQKIKPILQFSQLELDLIINHESLIYYKEILLCSWVMKIIMWEPER